METIKSKRDFERVFKGGRRINDRLVRLCVMPSDAPVPRAAFVCAKRFGNAACRNRSKRVLRAAAREASFPPEGYEAILFSTAGTRTARSWEVARALERLAKRI